MEKNTKERIRKEVERVNRILNDPEMIPGIYNFCDLWCKRCTQTRRCSSFKLENETRDTGNYSGKQDETFWEGLQLSFEVASHLLEECKRKFDLDPAVFEEKESEKVERNPEEIAQNHKVVKLADEYSDKAYQWLEENYVKSKKKYYYLRKLGVSGGVSLYDAYEVCSYYLNVIEHKSYCACLFSFSDKVTDLHLGSAKVALIAIDRSMGAWVKILEIFPDDQDEIIFLLGLLDQTKRLLLEAFPGAMEFKRPGFDDQ